MFNVDPVTVTTRTLRDDCYLMPHIPSRYVVSLPDAVRVPEARFNADVVWDYIHEHGDNDATVLHDGIVSIFNVIGFDDLADACASARAYGHRMVFDQVRREYMLAP